MRILTVRQPWAWAIIHGGKDVENRSRNIAGNYRGPIAIHAGMAIDAEAAYDLSLVSAWREAFMPTTYDRRGIGWGEIPDLRAPEWDDPDIGHLALGHIIGVVDLVGAHEDGGPGPYDRHDYLCCESPWAESGEWHLELTNPRPLLTPIPHKGALGLRTLDAELEARIWEQVGAVTPKRIQMSRKHPWRAENPDAVIVARPSKWGNPFKVEGTLTPEQAVAHYRHLMTQDTRRAAIDRAIIRAELAGKDLACWCSLDQPCHADVLLELANRP